MNLFGLVVLFWYETKKTQLHKELEQEREARVKLGTHTHKKIIILKLKWLFKPLEH